MSPEARPLHTKVRDLIHGMESTRSTIDLENLTYRLAYKVFPGSDPPPYLFHIAQVATVTDSMLRSQNPEEKEWGKRYAYAHDIGRCVDFGKRHTMAGARILRAFGFDKSLITYTLAHHRWGLGIPLLEPDDFPEHVEHALQNGKVEELIDQIIEHRGLAALAVLLADNSKRPVSRGSFLSEIAPFDDNLAQELIAVQIQRGRYTKGSIEHKHDELGAQFLKSMIPHLERRLGTVYFDRADGQNAITQSQIRWPMYQSDVLAKWQKIHYDQTHGAKEF